MAVLREVDIKEVPELDIDTDMNSYMEEGEVDPTLVLNVEI